jgi:hypothetical protein
VSAGQVDRPLSESSTRLATTVQNATPVRAPIAPPISAWCLHGGVEAAIDRCGRLPRLEPCWQIGGQWRRRLGLGQTRHGEDEGSGEPGKSVQHEASSGW